MEVVSGIKDQAELSFCSNPITVIMVIMVTIIRFAPSELPRQAEQHGNGQSRRSCRVVLSWVGSNHEPCIMCENDQDKVAHHHNVKKFCCTGNLLARSTKQIALTSSDLRKMQNTSKHTQL